MGNVDKAREKLERERITAGSAQDKIKEFCLLWLDVSDKAAELILAEDKNIAKAYSFMKEKASQKRSGASCVCIPPGEAAEVILEYFGMKKDEAQQELGHGLMYKLMIAASKKFRSYGMTEPETEKPHPVAEVEETEEVEEDVAVEQPHRAAVEQPHRAAVDLSAFSMEELL